MAREFPILQMDGPATSMVESLSLADDKTAPLPGSAYFEGSDLVYRTFIVNNHSYAKALRQYQKLMVELARAMWGRMDQVNQEAQEKKLWNDEFPLSPMIIFRVRPSLVQIKNPHGTPIGYRIRTRLAVFPDLTEAQWEDFPIKPHSEGDDVQETP